MRRQAFTLIELLVSVGILTLIVLLMYGTIGSSKIANKTLKKHTMQEQNRTMLYALLYQDLWESHSIKTLSSSDKHFTIIQMQTNNSLYNIALPYVTYYVHSETLSLIRLEAAREIRLPISYEEKSSIHADAFLENVTDFNLYEHIDNTAQTSKSREINKTKDQNSTAAYIPSNYLLYLNTKTILSPLLIELSI